MSVGGCFHVISVHNYSSGLGSTGSSNTARVCLAAGSSERLPGRSRQAFAKQSHVLQSSFCRTCQCLPVFSGNDMLLGFPRMKTISTPIRLLQHSECELKRALCDVTSQWLSPQAGTYV